MGLIGYRRKNGFTIMELVIVMTLTVTVLGIIWTMFNVSSRIISDVTIKSDLQREGQAIQEKLSNIGMQASGVADVYHNDEDIHIIQINLYYMSPDKASPVYIIYDNSNKKLYVYQLGYINIHDINREVLLNNNYKLLSNNVNSIIINNESIVDIEENDFININSIEFNIALSKKKTYSNDIIIQPPIKVRTVFRNK